MSEISAQQVKELRDITGAGMMDAKSALLEAEGDQDLAMEILTRKGIVKSAERSDREAKDGAIAIASAEDKRACGLAHLSAETDFSAKSGDFVELTSQLAEAALAEGPKALEKFQEEIDKIRLKKKENIEVQRLELIQAENSNDLDSYLHIQDGRGINAVVVEGSGVPTEALHQVSLHIAFAKPAFLAKDEIPEDQIQDQLKLAKQRAQEEGKPEEALEKIAQGRLTGWFKERVLLEQGLHGDKTKVQDTLEGGSIIRFIQTYIR